MRSGCSRRKWAKQSRKVFVLQALLATKALRCGYNQSRIVRHELNFLKLQVKVVHVSTGTGSWNTGTCSASESFLSFVVLCRNSSYFQDAHIYINCTLASNLNRHASDNNSRSPKIKQLRSIKLRPKRQGDQ